MASTHATSRKLGRLQHPQQDELLHEAYRSSNGYAGRLSIFVRCVAEGSFVFGIPRFVDSLHNGEAYLQAGISRKHTASSCFT